MIISPKKFSEKIKLDSSLRKKEDEQKKIKLFNHDENIKVNNVSKFFYEDNNFPKGETSISHLGGSIFTQSKENNFQGKSSYSENNNFPKENRIAEGNTSLREARSPSGINFQGKSSYSENNNFLKGNRIFEDKRSSTPICQPFNTIHPKNLNNSQRKNIIEVEENLLNEETILQNNNNNESGFQEILKKLNELETKVNITLNTNKDIEKEVQENLEELPEEEKTSKRQELVNELILMGQKNPQFQISIPYENTSLNYLNTIVKAYKKQINKYNGNIYIKIGLQAFFYGVEFCLTKLKIDARGFATYQIKNISKYEQIITELTDSYFSGEGGELKLSIEQRFIFLILFQGGIFLLMKFGENFLGSGTVNMITNFLENSVCNYLTSSSNSAPVSVQTSTSNMFNNFFSPTSSNNSPFVNNTKPIIPDEALKTPVMVPTPNNNNQTSSRRLSPKKRKETEKN